MLCISETVRTTRTPDGAVILDIRQNRLLSLNLVGATILELIQRQYGEAEITEEISRLYTTPAEIVGADVRTFVEKLIDLKILSETVAIG